MSKPRLRQIGELEFVEIPGEPQNGQCVLLFHGYGADARDLVPLYQYLKTPAGTTWIFPNGILEVPLGPHFTGRAWYPLDMAELERARMMGTYRDFTDLVPEGTEKLEASVSEALQSLGFKWNQVVLGGFSQGAMLATSLALSAPEAPKGLVIFSGALLNRKVWEERARKRAGLKFYQSHGQFDDLLSLEGARKLEMTLKAGGMIGNLHVFNGGHEIPASALEGAHKYLQEVMA